MLKNGFMMIYGSVYYLCYVMFNKLGLQQVSDLWIYGYIYSWMGFCGPSCDLGGPLGRMEHETTVIETGIEELENSDVMAVPRRVSHFFSLVV